MTSGGNSSKLISILSFVVVVVVVVFVVVVVVDAFSFISYFLTNNSSFLASFATTAIMAESITGPDTASE
jgi:hypothetical protein